MPNRYLSLTAVLLLSYLDTASTALGNQPAAPTHDAAQGPSAAVPDGSLNPPAFPPDKTVHQTLQLNGRTLSYDATVGSLPVLDEKGKPTAEVMFIAYTIPGARRPVTFVMNGGPGWPTVPLNLGAIGPKLLPFGIVGASPSAPAAPVDNPGTWLDFTDLVFIDAIGTGYSHSFLSKEETRKHFYTPTGDVEYLSHFIVDWLTRNERLTSAKYFLGESYAGFRGPRITYYLQTVLGVAFNGLVLVSPYLDPHAYTDGDVSPLPWMMSLPSITAANLERHGQLTSARMAEVIDYTRGEYATDLLKGRSDPAANDRIVNRVTALSGLDAGFVRRSGGRLDSKAYVREIYRAEAKLGSIIDSNFTVYDPFPFAPAQVSGDPLGDSVVAPDTTAILDFITRTVGWKYSGRYNSGSNDIFNLWNDGDGHSPWNDGDDVERGSVKELHQVIAIDPNLQVLIAHGWNDLDCPFMASILIADQLPQMDGQPHVEVKEYAGGHMFYSRRSSQLELRSDAMKMYAAR